MRACCKPSAELTHTDLTVTLQGGYHGCTPPPPSAEESAEAPRGQVPCPPVRVRENSVSQTPGLDVQAPVCQFGCWSHGPSITSTSQLLEQVTWPSRASVCHL